jgi:hypothetical protein
VPIKQISTDTRAAHITCEVPAPMPRFGIELHAQIPDFTVSVIDFRTSEFALL